MLVWVSKQRGKKDKLSEEKIAKLDVIGFRWREDLKRLTEERWQKRYAQLKQFKAENGHCQVSEKSKTHPQLGHWVANLRLYPNRISEEKKKLLEEIGFAWSEDIERSKKETWLNHYERLKDFFEKHGHCRVPQNYSTTQTFYSWVKTQYAFQSRLSPERKAMLDQINFHWDGIMKNRNRDKWNRKYRKLKAYFDAHGHINLSRKGKQRQPLLYWIQTLRRYREKGKLSANQIYRLDQLDFKWKEDIQKEKDEKWMINYRQLVAHQRKYGHINVTTASVGEKFMRWTSRQRQNQFSMKEWKLNLLNNLNFEWNVYKIYKM